MKARKRSYDQWCGCARALDIVGERWTLLLVRDLLLGPKRYKDLLAGLPGIGTNLLAQRLRELEEQGVLERVVLPAPAGATVYRLTPRGAGLEPVVLALAGWGSQFLGTPRTSDAILPDPFFVSLRASFKPDAARGLRERYAFRIADRLFEVAVADGSFSARHGETSTPSATFTTDAKTLFALRRRELSPKRAVSSGKVRVDGDPNGLDRFVQVFAWSTEALARTAGA